MFWMCILHIKNSQLSLNLKIIKFSTLFKKWPIRGFFATAVDIGVSTSMTNNNLQTHGRQI
jgi:hypothetical protein